MRVASFSFQRFSCADGRDGIVLALGDGSGRRGLGEAAPLPGFAPDDVRTCIEAARAAILGLGEVRELETPIHAVARAVAPVAGVLAGAPSARFAVETALLDLIARRRGVPLRTALGGARAYERVATNGLLFADRPAAELVARAQMLVARGMKVLKIKLRARDDAGFERERSALAKLRAALPRVELRLDPNAAWSLAEARRRLSALAPLGPRYVEQPVACGELGRLGRAALPWAADESLVDPLEAEMLITERVCAVYVIKPALVGGLVRAVELAARAQATGRDVVMTHAFDGPVGFAAACGLALGLHRAPLACGLDPEGVLSAVDAERVPQLRTPGWVMGVDAPGLGVDWPA